MNWPIIVPLISLAEYCKGTAMYLVFDSFRTEVSPGTVLCPLDLKSGDTVPYP